MPQESPFKVETPKFEKEKTHLEKFQDFLGDGFEEAFLALLPSDDIKDMPPKYKYGLGTIVILSLMGIFLAIFLSSYFTSLSAQFLSPDMSSSKYCETIPVANTGTYLATQSGYWQGNDGFQYAAASYEVSATSYTVSESEYTNVMTTLYHDLVKVGNLSAHSDLGNNIIYWTSFTALPDNSNTAQRFSLVGDPLVVFNRQNIMGTVSSITGVCNATSVSSYDEGRGYVTLTYSILDYIYNINCLEAIDPFYFGYIEGINSEIFQIYFDVRTLMTGIAMNSGIINYAQIVEITEDTSSFTYDGKVYNSSSYYNPQFPGMQPLMCLTGFEYPICAITLGVVYGVPFFLHKGNSTTLPQRCFCNRMTDFEKGDAYSECNLFEFLAGFIFYESDSPNQLLQLLEKFDYNVTKITELAFNASYAASFWGLTSPYQSELNNEENRNKAYEFCRIGNQTCSIVTFSLFDFNYNWAISSYYFQLQFGACQDSISPSWENWEKLIATPYAPLIQQYQKCYDSPTDVFLTQLGVSWANLGVLTPFFVIAFFMMIIFYQRCTGDIIPTAYSRKERDDVLQALAISLLLARDRQKISQFGSVTNGGELEGFPRSDSILKNVTLNSLVKDLENDAEYHLNTYKLDDKIQEYRVSWKALGHQLYATTVSPLSAHFHANGAMPPDRDSVTGDVLAHPSDRPKMKSYELTGIQPSLTSSSLSKTKKKEDILVLNADCRLERAASIGFTLDLSNKRDILSKLDQLYDTIYEIAQRHSLYSENDRRKSVLNDYDPYFQAVGFLAKLDQSITRIGGSFGRLSNISLDSDDEEGEEKLELPSDEFFNEFIEKVYHLLALHVSVTKGCVSQEESYIRSSYGDNVGYEISGEIITLNELYQKLSNANKV